MVQKRIEALAQLNDCLLAHLYILLGIISLFMSSSHLKAITLSMSNTSLGQSAPTLQTFPGTPSFSSKSFNEFNFFQSSPKKALPSFPSLSAQQQLIESTLQIRSTQYQTLLIFEKELELEILEEKTRIRKYQQILKRKAAPTAEIRKKIADGVELFEKKKEYAINLEKHIKEKLERLEEQHWQEVTNLEVKLERQFQNLERKLNEQSRSFGDILHQKKREMEDISHRKEACTAELEKIIHQKEVRARRNSEVRKENSRKKKEFQFVNQEYRQLEAELQQLQKQEKQLEVANIRLKQLMTIEEQHTKACMVIQRAIILKEQQKVRLEAYNRETSKQYETNLIPHLKTMIKEKSKQNDVLSKKLDEKNRFITELTDRYQKRRQQAAEIQSKFRRTLSAN